jgi:hypothetical protein
MVDRKVVPFDEFYYQLKLMHLFLLQPVLLYSCHMVRKFLNIDTEHNKTQQSQNVEARRR